MRVLTVTAMASAAVLGWTAPAAADTTVQVICEARVYSGGFRQCVGNGGFNSDYGNYQPGTTKTASGSDALEQYDAIASARANYGALGVAGSAAGGGGQPRVNSLADAIWLDSFTILSSTLSAGSNVTVRVTQIIDIHSLFAVSAGRYPITGSQILFSSHIFNFGDLGNACTSISVDGFGNYDANGQCHQPGTTLLHIGKNIITKDIIVPVGETRPLTARLSGTSLYYNAFSSPSGAGSSGFDVFNTAHSYLTVLTPGASVNAFSGHNYALPAVPEPASWALMIIGFGSIGGRLRRQRRLLPASIRLHSV